MANKLFVGGLPFDFTDDKLRELFTPHGTVVTATMVPDPKHGRTRGFGFVAMSSDAESSVAMEKLKGTVIGEKTIWVTEAREKEKQEKPARPPLRAEDVAQAPRWEGRRPGGPPQRFEGRRPFPPRERGSFDRGRSSGSGSRGPRRSSEPYKFQEGGNRPPRPTGDSAPSYFRPDGPRDRPSFRGPSRDSKPGAWRGPRPTSFGDRRPRPNEGTSAGHPPSQDRKPFGRPPYPYKGDRPGDRTGHFPSRGQHGPKPYGKGPSANRRPSRPFEERSGPPNPGRRPGGPDPAHHKFGKFFKRPSKPSDHGDKPRSRPRSRP